MSLYLAAVIYDGSEFAGWAKQPQQFTVQGYIEKVLSKIFQQKIWKEIQVQKDKKQSSESSKNNSFPLPAKMIIGAGIVGVLAFLVVVIWRFRTKNQ